MRSEATVRYVTLFALCLGLATAACSTSTESSPAPTTSEAGTDAGPTPAEDAALHDAGASDAPVACNAVPALDPLLTLEQVPAAVPAPTGGNIADGTYVLKAYRRYTGVGGPSGPLPERRFHETSVYEGNQLKVNYGEPTFNVQETYKHEVTGTSFVHTRTCPADPPAVFPGVYSATATTISYFEARGGEVWDEFYFERVP